MPIMNRTRDSILADGFEECNSAWEQTKGMMFRKKVKPLVFNFDNQGVVKLHSWFCPDHMDLIFLDENWQIVELQAEWPPWSSYKSQVPFMFLLELPRGTIYNSRTQVGDVVHIIK